jgi:hypothetical protein
VSFGPSSLHTLPSRFISARTTHPEIVSTTSAIAAGWFALCCGVGIKLTTSQLIVTTSGLERVPRFAVRALVV